VRNMAYIGSKGYYVKKLKENGIREMDGKKLESFKSYDLINLYCKEVKGENNK
jgi:hypothetical protein